jgi:hypothetical protein
MEQQQPEEISLRWSDWYYRNDRIKDARSGGIKIPNKRPGVYEVKLEASEERLTIGRASDLRMRIRQGLLRGKTPHSSGDRIRESEDLSNVVIRWAETAKPAAVEERLHMSYVEKHGRWPKYTHHT